MPLQPSDVFRRKLHSSAQSHRLRQSFHWVCSTKRVGQHFSARDNCMCVSYLLFCAYICKEGWQKRWKQGMHLSIAHNIYLKIMKNITFLSAIIDQEWRHFQLLTINDWAENIEKLSVILLSFFLFSFLVKQQSFFLYPYLFIILTSREIKECVKLCEVK